MYLALITVLSHNLFKNHFKQLFSSIDTQHFDDEDKTGTNIGHAMLPKIKNLKLELMGCAKPML